MEIWRAVPGFEGLYEVSDQGRVRSLDRVLHSESSKRGYPRKVRGQILSPQKHSAGYAHVTLSGELRLVHALVLGAFVGVCPEGHECAHDNGDKRDNKLVNLRYATHVANCADRKTHGTEVQGVRNARAVLNDRSVADIRRRASGGETYEAIAANYPVGSRAIGKIARRERWSHV